MVIKYPIGNFELGIGVLSVFIFLQSSILNPQYPILKTPFQIKNHQLVILSPIGDFHFQFSNVKPIEERNVQ